MKGSIEPATPSTSRACGFTTAQVFSMLDSDNENELLNDVDYPSDEIASSSESVQSDHSNVNAQNFANFRPTTAIIAANGKKQQVQMAKTRVYVFTT